MCVCVLLCRRRVSSAGSIWRLSMSSCTAAVKSCSIWVNSSTRSWAETGASAWSTAPGCAWTTRWASLQTQHLKRQFTQKSWFCHHLLTLRLFQTFFFKKVSFFCWTYFEKTWVIKQFLVPIGFNSIFLFHTMEVNGYRQLFSYQHSSKYLLDIFFTSVFIWMTFMHVFQRFKNNGLLSHEREVSKLQEDASVLIEDKHPGSSAVKVFIHSFIHSFVQSFIHSFIHSFVQSFIQSFIHSFLCSFIQSVSQMFCYSFVISCLFVIYLLTC